MKVKDSAECTAQFCLDTNPSWPSNLRKGLVAYYPFNGNTNDVSGNGNNPTTVLRATLTRDRYGKNNAAYHFDGDSYIRGNSSNYPSTTRTVSFWYKGTNLTLTGLHQCVFGYGGGDCGNSWITIFGNTPDFSISGHCKKFGILINDPLPINNYWHNLTISYDGSYIKIYLNGCLVKSEYKGTITTTDVFNKSFYIGSIPNQYGIIPYKDEDPGFQWFNGDIDDVAIWNRALTDEEVKFIAQPPCHAEITIAVNPGNTACENELASFTASVKNYTAPAHYQWKLNGKDVGFDKATYSTVTLKNGDVVSCIFMSASGCVLDSSNSITMTVNAAQPVSVSITSDDADYTICSGTPVTFTAKPTNGGTSPAYQWKVNGVNVGTNSPTYPAPSLADKDVISCVLTTSLSSCVSGSPATSNSITMTVNAPLPVSVSITSDDADNTICAGAPVTFTANPTNGGTSPAYQWKVNGVNVGTNSPTYPAPSLADKDVIRCVLTSSLSSCVSGSPATSNSITMTVNAPPPVGVSITSDDADNTICSGTPVTCTAKPTNGGTSPTYQWKVNGINVGTNSSTYTASSLADKDVVSCVLTSSLSSCISGNPATSNSITITVNSNPTVALVPEITINAGSTVQLNPTITGNIATYSWTPVVGLANSTIRNPVASPSTNTTYKLEVVSTNGCRGNGEITIRSLQKILIPNAFTPNGDGINDTWQIYSLSTYTNCTVEVFDRYGQSVYRSVGYNTPWDGTFKGKVLPVATYYYVIDLKEGSKLLSGSVVILR